MSTVTFVSLLLPSDLTDVYLPFRPCLAVIVPLFFPISSKMANDDIYYSCYITIPPDHVTILDDTAVEVYTQRITC